MSRLIPLLLWAVAVGLSLAIQRSPLNSYVTLRESEALCPTNLGLHRREPFLFVRGGAQDSDDEEYDEDEYDDEENDQEEEEEEEDIQENLDESPSISEAAVSITERSFRLFGKVALATANAMQRALRAAFYPEEDEKDFEEEDSSFISSVRKTLVRMIKAAFSPPKSDASQPIHVTKKQIKKKKEKVLDSDENENDSETPNDEPHSQNDFGEFLSTTYGIMDKRGEDAPEFMGGSLADAFKTAQDEARLLVIYIPLSSKPSKNVDDPDRIAITSLLSEDVVKAANKRARKKGDDSGSFLFWGALPGSTEANTAIKKLKAQQKNIKGKKTPILLIAYPAQVADKTGKARIAPRLLAQHHCSPPPSSSLMSEWLESMRKRQAKHFHTMQLMRNEEMLLKKRTEGYKENIRLTKEREEREAREAAERAAKEAAELAHKEAVKMRRVELLESLPEEDTSTEAKTIALRFTDGRTEKRKFSPDEPVGTIFNWVDAVFEIERETFKLTTLNGRMSFEWDTDDIEKSLEEAGLGRTTGFRIIEKKTEEPKNSEE